jgi:hypothetical protein
VIGTLSLNNHILYLSAATPSHQKKPFTLHLIVVLPARLPLRDRKGRLPRPAPLKSKSESPLRDNPARAHPAGIRHLPAPPAVRPSDKVQISSVSFSLLVSWPVYSRFVLRSPLPMLDFLRWDVECCHYGQSWDGVRGLGSILWPNWEFLGSGMDYGLELGIVFMSA